MNGKKAKELRKYFEKHVDEIYGLLKDRVGPQIDRNPTMATFRTLFQNFKAAVKRGDLVKKKGKYVKKEK